MQNKEHFINGIRKFMQTETLTAPLLKELVERIDVYEVEGKGKNRTQRLMIQYRFVGYIDVPETVPDEYFKEETRKGVAVQHIQVPFRHKQKSRRTRSHNIEEALFTKKKLKVIIKLINRWKYDFQRFQAAQTSHTT